MDYDSIARSYNELHREEQLKKLEIVKKYLKINKNTKLLDIGCGTGISTNFFNCKTTGIDPSKEMIKQGKGNLLIGNAENLPFINNSFDVVISVTAIHNFKDYKKAIKEMKRVLKSNGTIVITLLKKAKKYKEIKSYLEKQFKLKAIDSEKDTIFMAKNVK